jgi:nitroreductase
MDLDEAIRGRRMCRDFSDAGVDPAVVDRVLDRARRAPSAGHTQGWSFLVLEGGEQVGRFWSANADAAWLAAPSLPGLLRAPVVVVPWCSRAAYVERYAEPDKASDQDKASDLGPASGRGGDRGPAVWAVDYWTVDVSFATMLLLLGCVAEGLGALFFALRPGAEVRLRAAFGVPDGWEPIGGVALGWPATPATGQEPASGSARRGRRRRAEVVRRGGWSAP